MVQKIIKNANATFETLGLIQKFGESWNESIAPALYKNMESGLYTSSLRVGSNKDILSMSWLILCRMFFVAVKYSNGPFKYNAVL